MRLSKATCVVLALGFLLIALTAGRVCAAWYDNGIPVGSTYQNEDQAEMAPDGQGGTIVVFVRYSTTQDLYAQRVDAYGNLLWAPGGVPICTASGNQSSCRIVADGSGGAIMAWQDTRGTDTDIYAQRVDAAGTVLWTANGDAVVTASGYQSSVSLAPDGTSGAIIAWMDTRGSDRDIYAQRLDRYGDYQWTEDGNLICGAANNQEQPLIVQDESGGAVIAWYDERTDYELYAQRVSSTGSVLWDADGEAIRLSPPYPIYMVMVSDEAGGAIIVWDEDAGVDDDVRAQHIDYHGDLQWGTDGILVGPSGDYQNSAAVAPDGAGGAVIAWQDHRSGVDTDIYAQHINAFGGTQWMAGGVPVCVFSGNQNYVLCVPDGEGGVVVSWADRRSGDDEIYAQHVMPSGAVAWDSGGALVCSVEGIVNYGIVGDDAGNSILAWNDNRNGVDNDIYAQRMGWLGNWGNRAPYIASAEDVPGDQGGYVNVQWDASPVDPPPYGLITDYTVWRAIEQGLLSTMVADGLPILESASEIVPRAMVDGAIRVQRLASGALFYWQLAATVDAYGQDSYAWPVETLFDSTSVCEDYHYFQVLAHGTEAGEFWESDTASARSVDNLAPGTPLNLAGEYESPPGELLMNWDPNMEADLSDYAVYRGATEEFVPDETSLIGAPSDTFFVDTEFNAGAEEYYKVSAADIHENESGYALLRPEDISGVGPSVPLVTALEQNVPNPFSPETVIRFSLAERGHVSLRVYDVEGRPVRALVNDERRPDRYEAHWDSRDDRGRSVAPGVYFYKLVAPGYSRTMKMVLLK